METRDDFSLTTKRILAERAGHRCSFPGCSQVTIGPSDEAVDARSNVGMACHISAASGGPGARRYNPSLTPEERASSSNGIWMCYIHGKLIDTDEVRFTVDVLRCWKQIAEARAKARLEGFNEDDFLDGILPGACSLQLDSAGCENEIIGNAIQDAGLRELWGKDLTDSIRDLCIEIVRNTFSHADARSVSLEISGDSIKLLDDGARFNSWELFTAAQRRGGTLAFQRVVRDFSHRVVVATGTEAGRNLHEFTLIRAADDVLYVTPCSVRLSWKDLKRGATRDPLGVPDECRVVYIILPIFMTISDSVILEEKLYPIKADGRYFIFVNDGNLSEAAQRIISERFPDSPIVAVEPRRRRPLTRP